MVFLTFLIFVAKTNVFLMALIFKSSFWELAVLLTFLV